MLNTNLCGLCTTHVQSLEFLLSKFENRPLTLPSPPLGGEDEGEGGADGFWLRPCRAVISVAKKLFFLPATAIYIPPLEIGGDFFQSTKPFLTMTVKFFF